MTLIGERDTLTSVQLRITFIYILLLASERSEQDTLRSVQSRIADIYIIGERAKRARHSQVCSIENRICISIGNSTVSRAIRN